MYENCWRERWSWKSRFVTNSHCCCKTNRKNEWVKKNDDEYRYLYDEREKNREKKNADKNTQGNFSFCNRALTERKKGFRSVTYLFYASGEKKKHRGKTKDMRAWQDKQISDKKENQDFKMLCKMTIETGVWSQLMCSKVLERRGVAYDPFGQ